MLRSTDTLFFVDSVIVQKAKEKRKETGRLILTWSQLSRVTQYSNGIGKGSVENLTLRVVRSSPTEDELQKEQAFVLLMRGNHDLQLFECYKATTGFSKKREYLET